MLACGTSSTDLLSPVVRPSADGQLHLVALYLMQYRLFQQTLNGTCLLSRIATIYSILPMM